MYALPLELFVKWSNWYHGFSSKAWVYENNHKVTQVFLVFRLSYTKSSGSKHGEVYGKSAMVY